MAQTSPAKPATKMTLPSDTEIQFERTFNAPRELVWRAFTDPALIVQWLGPSRLKTIVEHMDVRPGGKWRFIHVDTDGTEYGFHGDFLEVVRPERIKQTWVFEGFPDASSIETATLTEREGRTTVVSHARYKSKEHRDGHLNAGMEEGALESYDRLAKLVESLR
ncbi:MAG TPA: SRPBCC family protein [Candidatus Thermoplasmatota archaeon]|nr:SRPBCC family protein [Candidatus Thermoplasmatota archaeon]